MAESSYNPNIRFIADGEPVDANVANRPLVAEQSNVQYLKDRVDAAGLGEAVLLYGASLSPAVAVDMPVAFNPATGRFEPALAGISLDPSTGAVSPGVLADCLGVCSSKDGPTVGTIVQSGRYATTLTSAGANPTPGRYYLSASAPGMLVKQRPAVSIPILYWDGTYAYVTAPAIKDFLESHAHYRHFLACSPAGDSTVAGGRQSVSDPDSSVQGWLPAGHAAFDGQAPRGAVFGYNIAQDPTLLAIWPPTPPSSAVFVRDKGAATLGGTILPQGLDGLVYADRTTIWWMSDCEGDAPWPAAFPVAPAGPNSSTGAECPRAEDMQVYVSFTEMLLATDKSVVTDIAPAAGSPITIVDCAGNPATTGSLKLGLNLNFLTSPTLVDGAVVLKGLSGETFTEGKVVEGLLAGANVTLTSADTKAVGAGPSAATLYQGRVRVDVNTNLSERELAPDVVRLVGAEERPFQNILYIGFPATRASAMRMKFSIPYDGLPSSPTVVLRLTVYGRSAGTIPATTTTYSILPRPAAGAAVTLTAVATAVALDTNVTIGPNQYVEADSAPIPVTPGATLIVDFTRSGPDGYSDEVGVIRAGAVLTAG